MQQFKIVYKVGTANVCNSKSSKKRNAASRKLCSKSRSRKFVRTCIVNELHEIAVWNRDATGKINKLLVFPDVVPKIGRDA
jgi:hypothetical protein